MPRGARSDALYCSQSCRQASHRFGTGARLDAADATPRLVMAYADPPYPGNARALYSGHRDYLGEVDHEHLVAQLGATFPDGWALSTSASALPAVLALCPSDVRVAAWVKGARPPRSYGPLSAWEPVIVCGGRRPLREPAERVPDVLVHHNNPRLTDPERVIGAKPAAFCWWLFALLGLQHGDDLVDVYPGSGGVERAYARAQAAA